MEGQFEPMDQVRKNFRISWYRCPIAREDLKRLTRRSNIRGLFQAVGHLILIAVTAYLVFRFFYRRDWLWFALSLFAHGTFLTFLPMSAVHELAHKTVFTKKWLNMAFLWIYSILGWFNFTWYNISHTYHHLYTLHPRGDREVTLPKKPSLNFFYLLQLFTLNLFGGFESVGLFPTIGGTVKLAFTGKFSGSIGVGGNWLEDIFTPDQDKERKKAVNFARFLLVIHAAIIAVSIVFRLWPLMMVITFGTFIGNGLRYFIGVPMHTGLRDNVPDFRKCVRTITLNPFFSFLYWRMNWHIEHHMYAAVPCYYLKKMHKVVAAEMPEPRSLIGAWKEMRTAWKKQQTDPSYQFDTPIPGGTDRKPEEKDALESSLGDLTPDSMV
jgi:fatty acid desaturase